MKILRLCSGVWLASMVHLSGQVTVEVLLEQDQFLPGEAVSAAVRVVNRSGQKLEFGVEPDWVTFAIESRDGFIVNKLSEVPVLGAFELASSKRATKRVDLGPHFNLTRPGRYLVTATLRVKEWGVQVNSEPTAFTVIDGSKLWEREFGVPNTAASGRPPEVRKFMLQQANYLRSQLRLYVRLTDLTGTNALKVFPIGPMVSFSKPEPQMDAASNLHVLYQSGPRAFSYTVVNPDGDIAVRQTYEYAGTKPRLRADERGKISVVGGVRRPTVADLPKAANDDDAPSKP